MKIPKRNKLVTTRKARLFGILALLLALPLAIVLSQHTQNLEQQAQGSIKVGVNMQGIVSYGHGDQMQYMSMGDADNALQELQNMNVKIIRVFVANNQVSDTETANRLDNFLTRAGQHGISVDINLMHFFDIYGMHPQGTDQYYTNSVNLGGMNVSVLNDAFWTTGYKDRYKAFVTTVVSRNKGHSNIYAWEPCNECRDHEGNRQAFLSFMQDITATIKSIDPGHAISSGEEGSRVTGYTAAEFYGQLPNVDIVSIHVYNGDRGPAGDAAWARANGKRILIGEIGFSVSNSDRPTSLKNELNYWESQGAEAALHWAYEGSTFPVWQDGDGDSGIVNNRSDYDPLKCVISQFNGATCGAAPTATLTPPPPGVPTSTPLPPGNGPVGNPGSLSATCTSPTQVTLTWSPATNAVHYPVHLNDGRNGDAYGNSYSFPVTTDKTYGWWMEAVNAASTPPSSPAIGGPNFKCTGGSNEPPPTPFPTNVPDTGGSNHSGSIPQPTNLNSKCSVDARTVLLEWDASSNADHYILNFNGSIKDVYSSNKTHYRYSTSVTPNQTYLWQVHGNNTTDNSPESDKPSFKCKPPATPTAIPTERPSGGVCANGNYQCICRTTPRDDSTCLQQTAPWAVSLPQPWQSCTSTPSSCDPSAAGNQPPDTSTTGFIMIQIQDESGTPLAVNSGGLYVSNQSGSDSDNYNLAKGNVQQCFTKQPQVGLYKCKKYADRWYGGMGSASVPVGYSIVEGGNRLEDGKTPLNLVDGGTITITVVLRPTSGGGPIGSNPDFVPNCLNIQGPTTIRLGQTVKYLAQYDGPNTGKLAGTIDAVKTTNPNPKDAAAWEWGGIDVTGNWPPKETGYPSGVLSFKWTPTSAGVYQVFCRAFNENAGAECRGAPNTVDSSRYVCRGPGPMLTVNVTAAGVDTPDSRGDMCQFASTIGGNAMILGGGATNSQEPLVISAIAKPSFNIKIYSFAFYNLDNTPNDPKPIFYTANTPYIIQSASNTVTITQADITKPDLNNNAAVPKNIEIRGFFTDADGLLSNPDPKCNLTVHTAGIAGPTATPVITATATPAPNGQNQGGLIAAMGVLIVAVIVSLNFFFH